MLVHPILHADADAFYASLALRSRPDLAARPVAAVNHVFIASANYPARAAGVRAGTLVGDARRRCPELVMIDVPHAEVEEAGEALLDLFQQSARAVEPGSIEEAFLDVGAEGLQDAVDAGRRIRRRAAHELGLPVSVGVGRTKLMAKLASRAAKPDGLYVIDAPEEEALRSSLPLTEVWGVGGATRARLATIGVTTLAHLDGVDPDVLRQVAGTTMSRRLTGIRLGTDDAVVRPLESRTSITAEGSVRGYDRPDRSPSEIADDCIERVCRRAARAGLVAAGLTLVLVEEAGGAPRTRSRATASPTDDAAEWMRVGHELLAEARVPQLASLRATLTGLRHRDTVPATLF